MTPAQERLYRIVSGVLCAAFAVVGVLFFVVPDAVLSLFDGWSRALGLATFYSPADPFFVVLAAAYMVVVTGLAGSMARSPRDVASARLLAHAKLASAVLSLAVFFVRQPHLILLVNGVVDGAIAALVVLLVKLVRPGGERPA